MNKKVRRNRAAGTVAAVPTSFRDIFLSHRSVDNDFTWKLATAIERIVYLNRTLSCWVDEAEIRPGQSIPGMISNGLENSRFIALILTPAYFASESGWTDAEWHSAIYSDPDNRRGRILPILAEDCPYIPALLHHLKLIDMRGKDINFRKGLQQLLAVLRDEPLPRPVTYRGQLISSNRRIDRQTLVAERAVPDADPDVTLENLYCNLLPVESLPRTVYVAPISNALMRTRRDGTWAQPSKEAIKEVIRLAQQEIDPQHTFMPAFRVSEGKIYTFHDLEVVGNPLADVIEEDEVEALPTTSFFDNEDNRKLVISLLNMAISRHAEHVGLIADTTKHMRVFFPPKAGNERTIDWVPLKNSASRSVAKPCLKDGQLQFWRHSAAYLEILILANKFYLQITPTWVITNDGLHVRQGPKVGRLIIRWTGPERNLRVLYHIRFWTAILRAGHGGPIVIRAGDQHMDISSVPAFVQQSYGIADDHVNLLEQLDREAQLLSNYESAIADWAAEHESAATATDDEADWLEDEEQISNES